MLEWVAFLFSRGSSQSRHRNQVSCIAGRFFTKRWWLRKFVDALYAAGLFTLKWLIFFFLEENKESKSMAKGKCEI